MTTEQKQTYFVCWMVGLIICTTIGFVVGAIVGTSNMRVDAVKAGRAIWVPDENGATRFQWKEAQP